MGCNLDQVFLALVNRSIAATWLVAAVLVLRFALRRAPKWTRCLLWALVAARLVFSLSVPSSWSAFNLGNTPVNELGEIEYAKYTGQGVKPSAVFERPKLSVSAGTDGGQPSVTVGTEREHVYLPSLSRLWLAGVAAMLLYALISYLKLRRRVAASMERDGVWLCDDIESPFILGVLRPRVYLPSSLAEPQRSHVLAHEAAHLARRDHWWKPLGFALLAVYWFDPALWLAYVLLCRDIELACDERVYRDMALAERADYSRTLLEQSCARRAIAACPLAFGEVSVRERVKAALSYKKPAFWVLAVSAAACVVVAVCFLTNPAKLALDFSRDEISEAETYHITTVEDLGLRQLSGEELDVLYERLRDIPNAARKGNYAGLTPMYTLTFKVPYKGSFQLRGYNDEGTMTELYCEDWVRNKVETWRVEDNEFGRYVMELCKYGTGQASRGEEPIRTQETLRRLTLDDVRAFSEKGEALTWGDLESYEYYETGSGLHSRLYPIDGRFSLMASGTLTGLLSAVLYDAAAAESVDIRNSVDLHAFLDSHEKVQSVPFTAVLGFDGHYIDLELAPGFYQRRYIIRTWNNELGLLAESFGFTIDDHSADLDGDGVTELICNCVFGGDGARRVYVYRRSGNVIERGRIDYDRLNMTAWDDWGVNSTAEWYDAASGKLLVEYASLASSTMSRTFTCEAGCDAFDWEIYAAIE